MLSRRNVAVIALATGALAAVAGCGATGSPAAGPNPSTPLHLVRSAYSTTTARSGTTSRTANLRG